MNPKSSPRLVGAIAASLIAATASSAGAEGPNFVEKTLYTSDVQYRVTRTPDGHELNVEFDNFNVALLPGGSPTAVRTLSLKLPVSNSQNGAMFSFAPRGKVKCPEAAKCGMILWINGVTKTFDHSRNDGETAAFGSASLFPIPGAGAHQATLVLFVEREVKQTNVAAEMKVETVQFTIDDAFADETKK